jgi:hypothetical protein
MAERRTHIESDEMTPCPRCGTLNQARRHLPLDKPSPQPGASVGPRLARPETSLGEVAALLREKDQQLDRLHRENLELAGRVGFLQAEVLQLREQVTLLSARVRARGTSRGTL